MRNLKSGGTRKSSRRAPQCNRGLPVSALRAHEEALLEVRQPTPGSRPTCRQRGSRILHTRSKGFIFCACGDARCGGAQLCTLRKDSGGEKEAGEASARAAAAKRRALISCAHGGRICCKGVLVLESKGRPRVLQYKPRLPQSTRVAWNYRSDARSAFSLKPGRTLSPTSFLTAQA